MSNPTRTALLAIGSILLVGAIVKLSFIGVYMSEAPLYVGLLFVGGVCVYIGSKMKKRGDEDDEPDEGSNDIVG